MQRTWGSFNKMRCAECIHIETGGLVEMTLHYAEKHVRSYNINDGSAQRAAKIALEFEQRRTIQWKQNLEL